MRKGEQDSRKRLTGRSNTLRTVLCILALSVLFELFTWAALPLNTCLTLPVYQEDLYPGAEHYVSGYKVNGSEYVPDNDDPQLGFPLTGRRLQSIILEFEAPILNSVSGSVYFARSGEGLSEKNRISVYAEAGSQYLTAQLPKDVYTHLRLDIDQTFFLKRITTSPDLIITECCRSPFPVGQLIRVFIIVLCMWLVCRWMKRKCLISINGIQETRIQIESAITTYCGAGFLCVALLFVAFQVNRSNMASYSAVIPNNIAAAAMPSLGVPRSIRSDEFLVATASFFHDMAQGKCSVLALDMSSLTALLSNVFKLINPFYWGRLFLPTNYAFSWERFVPAVFAIYTFYRLFYIITKNGTFSLLASFLLGFSPGIQWWWGPSKVGMYSGTIIFFYNFFATESRAKKILNVWGLVCILSVMEREIYPAWGIPYIYLFGGILLAICIGEKGINFKKSDIPYIAVTIGLVLLSTAVYLSENGSAMSIEMETLYPGKRFIAGGGLSSDYWAHYLTAPFTTWKPLTISGTNQSEIAQCLHLFPVPTLIFLVKYKEFRKKPVMVWLMTAKMLCVIYMVFGIGDFLAKYTLLSLTWPGRLYLVWGVASFLLLLLECYYIVPTDIEEGTRTAWVQFTIVNVGVILYLTWVVVCQEAITAYIGGYFGCTAVGLILLANLLLRGKKKTFLAAMGVLTIITGVIVNPVNIGTAAINGTPLAKKVQEIDAQEPGKWIGLSDIHLPKYIYAQGVDCLNYVSWPPRFDLFEPLDEDGKYRDIYNRYAHVVINLVDSDTTFELMQPDYFHLNMNVNDLEKWDVRYVATKDPALQGTENVHFQQIYYDWLDQVNIYRVDYS